MIHDVLPEKGPRSHPYYAIEDAFLNVGFVDAEGTKRSVSVRHKVTGDGPPIVLVHGLMTSSYSWRLVLEALGRRYRVFVPDLIGAGLSDKPLDFRYSVDNVARFLGSYIHIVSKDPVYLVGNSLGGLYSLRALLRDETIARRFVLMHSPGYPLLRTKLLSSLFETPALGPAAAELVARAAHRFPRTFVAKNVHYARSDMMSEEEATEYGRLFETLDGARAFAKILDESLDPAEHASIIAKLRAHALSEETRLKTPIKLLFAKHDVMVPPSFGPKFHADLPGSELVWIRTFFKSTHPSALCRS